MELMDRVIEIVQWHDGEKSLADAIVSELVEWGVVSTSRAEQFSEIWAMTEAGV